MGTATMPGYRGQEVDRVIFTAHEWADKWAHLVHREMELVDHKPIAKVEAIRRIMESENPDTGKPHSASSAEKVVEGDAEYAAHLKTLRDVVLEKNQAWAHLETARLRARLGIALNAGGEA